MTIRDSIGLSGALSDTPLARRHEQLVVGKLARTLKPLPWDAFDRTAYPDDALRLGAELWSGLAVGEYASIGLFAEIAAGLTFTGAPFDFVFAATQVSGDEARHAEYCVRAASLFVGGAPAIQVPAEGLHAKLAPLVDIEEVDFAMLQYVAFSETLATALLTECKRRARDRLSRALFTSLLSDEIHHARLGWYYAAHRSPLWTPGERQQLADRTAEYVLGVEEEFWIGRDAPPSATRSARALGILDSKTQRAVIRDAMENEIVPAFDALGFGASRTWPLRRRGGRKAAKRPRRA
jgi:hypothetical protein